MQNYGQIGDIDQFITTVKLNKVHKSRNQPSYSQIIKEFQVVIRVLSFKCNSIDTIVNCT